MGEQRQPRVSDLIVVAALFVVIMVGLPWVVAALLPPRPPAASPVPGEEAALRGDYVGPGACAECHPGASALHANSGHARTIRPADDRRLARELDGRVVEDPERPGVTWSYLLADDRFSVERAEGGARERVEVDYALGSGHHATTLLTLTDPSPDRPRALEHRLTYFAREGRLGVTPGQRAGSGLSRDGPMGHELTPEETLKCFGCHTTRTSAEGPARLDPATMIPNVSCERCHGPGREHVEAARRGAGDLSMPFGVGSWTAGEQLRLCGDCHRHPSKAPPGVIRPDNVQLARFQPVGVIQSACYTQSHGAFSCVSCHDPHARARSDHAFYEAICLGCHAPPTHPDPFRAAAAPSGCIGCHMPAVDSGQGVLFADHWIRVRDDPAGRGACTLPTRGDARDASR